MHIQYLYNILILIYLSGVKVNPEFSFLAISPNHTLGNVQGVLTHSEGNREGLARGK
jgi:hypothetical protein